MSDHAEAPNNQMTAEQLRDLIHYEPETGVFTWRKSRSSRAPVGGVIGNMNSRGYLQTRLGGVAYTLHRLAFLYMTGEWPAHQVDHINADRADNKWANLREATISVNAQNRRAALAGSSSGLLGASWDSKHERWKAQIRVNGRTRHLGYFGSPEAAHQAYLMSKRAHHAGCTI